MSWSSWEVGCLLLSVAKLRSSPEFTNLVKKNKNKTRVGHIHLGSSSHPASNNSQTTFPVWTIFHEPDVEVLQLCALICRDAEPLAPQTDTCGSPLMRLPAEQFLDTWSLVHHKQGLSSPKSLIPSVRARAIRNFQLLHRVVYILGSVVGFGIGFCVRRCKSWTWSWGESCLKCINEVG